MKYKLSALLLISGLFLNTALFAATLPKNLNLVYRVKIAGMNIGTLDRELNAEGKGIYTVTSETNATGIAAILLNDTYREKSRFKVKDGMIFPLNYRRSPDKKPEKARIASFDWNKKKVTLNNDRVYDISPGVQDPASFLFFWMLTPPRKGQTGKISLVDGKRMSQYEFKIIDHEKVESLWGKINTLRIERQKEGSPDKILRMWLATDYSYIPVVIENIRPKYTMTFRLEKANGL
ncbi:MAG: DUF3108 domain-containing protein [Gammaproteobacteria bacterium]|nr:DUF3108 domain-containing protein [Gammaproteobacteria bacterium]